MHNNQVKQIATRIQRCKVDSALEEVSICKDEEVMTVRQQPVIDTEDCLIFQWNLPGYLGIACSKLDYTDFVKGGNGCTKKTEINQSAIEDYIFM